MSKDLDAKVDQLEAAVDPNTVISVGGVNFTPAKLMIAGGIISSILGGLYGTFEVYKDYMSMKECRFLKSKWKQQRVPLKKQLAMQTKLRMISSEIFEE